LFQEKWKEKSLYTLSTGAISLLTIFDPWLVESVDMESRSISPWENALTMKSADFSRVRLERVFFYKEE
jgi:hypothetical protein